jgi:hypothetical protein
VKEFISFCRESKGFRICWLTYSKK